MRVAHSLEEAKPEHETVLTIGAFDGLHLGHQELLRRLTEQAHRTDRLSAVLTFDPLPRSVLDSAGNAICLIMLEDKMALLEQWGVDLLIVLPFTTQLAQTSAQEFVHLLRQYLRMRELWVGWDFALGRGRAGDVAVLRKLASTLGFGLHVIRPVRDGEVVISSSQIRSLISEGRVDEAADMLGRFHKLSGVVQHGAARGAQLGFPTANLQVAEHCALPAAGVYAVYATVRGRTHPAVANVGFRPTFDGGALTVEVHVLDLKQDLYGEELKIEFVKRLRAEQRFESAAKLCKQIEKDITAAREIL